MKKLIYFILISLQVPLTAQKVDYISKQIDSLFNELEPSEVFNAAKKLKEKVDIKYYSIAFDMIPEMQDTFNIDRFVKLNHVRSIPVSFFQDKILYDKAKSLYLRATKLLIRESRGQLDILKAIKVIPAFQSEIYPQLKLEIENSGGTWERREIPALEIYPPIKKIHQPTKGNKNEE